MTTPAINPSTTLEAEQVMRGINLVISVRQSPRFLLRYWFGLHLMALGARIVGFGLLKIETVS